MKTVKLHNASSTGTPITLNYCHTFSSKLQGLMFTKQLDQDAGIILVENQESRVNTAIHMLFMNFDITVLWLNKDLVIVDKALAKRWRPIYMPKQPAQYVVELHVAHFPGFNPGDQLVLTQAA